MGRSSRASKVGVGLTLAILALGSAGVSAHRRDEYLQAARLGIEPGSVRIELDLTPGIALADAIIGDIDRDRDGRLTADEQHDYAARALEALHVEVDGLGLSVQLAASRFPDLDAMRRGEGVIQITSSVPVQPLSAGSHQLLFRNGHHPESSVYLANALVPDSDRVAVRAQRRDPDQRELTIDYSLSAAPSRATTGWLPGSIAFSALLLGIAALRRLTRASLPSARL
jgi:hypothetical protein